MELAAVLCSQSLENFSAILHNYCDLLLGESFSLPGDMAVACQLPLELLFVLPRRLARACQSFVVFGSGGTILSILAVFDPVCSKEIFATLHCYSDLWSTSFSIWHVGFQWRAAPC